MCVCAHANLMPNAEKRKFNLSLPLVCSLLGEKKCLISLSLRALGCHMLVMPFLTAWAYHKGGMRGCRSSAWHIGSARKPKRRSTTRLSLLSYFKMYTTVEGSISISLEYISSHFHGNPNEKGYLHLFIYGKILVRNILSQEFLYLTTNKSIF